MKQKFKRENQVEEAVKDGKNNKEKYKKTGDHTHLAEGLLKHDSGKVSDLQRNTMATRSKPGGGRQALGSRGV